MWGSQPRDSIKGRHGYNRLTAPVHGHGVSRRPIRPVELGVVPLTACLTDDTRRSDPDAAAGESACGGVARLARAVAYETVFAILARLVDEGVSRRVCRGGHWRKSTLLDIPPGATSARCTKTYTLDPSGHVGQDLWT